jgi:putative glutamine amidotransferase
MAKHREKKMFRLNFSPVGDRSLGRKRGLLKFLLPFLLSLSLFFLPLYSQPEERYFDKVSADAIKKQPHLVIFYPSPGTLRALLSLQENGLIDLKKVVVVGVFHSLEKTRYSESLRFLKEEKSINLHFHRLEAEVSPAELFQKNAWTQEFEVIFNKSHGMIFFGGPDIPPSLYGEKTLLLTQIEDPWRHYLELSALFHLLGSSRNEAFRPLLASKPEYPVLGICLGGQSMNVATGGSLTQDIAWEIYGQKTFEDLIALGETAWHTNPFYHLFPDSRNKYFPYELHPIKLMPDGLFCREMGFKPEDKPRVLSAHHQQVKKPGKGFKIIATSLDGKVSEAFEHELFPHVLALQFHPEFPVLWDKTAFYRFRPEDKELRSPYSLLENSPPSLDFHRKLWAWFMEKLQASYLKK